MRHMHLFQELEPAPGLSAMTFFRLCAIFASFICVPWYVPRKYKWYVPHKYKCGRIYITYTYTYITYTYTYITYTYKCGRIYMCAMILSVYIFHTCVWYMYISYMCIICMIYKYILISHTHINAAYHLYDIYIYTYITHTYKCGRIYMCAVIRPYVSHDALICGTWPIKFVPWLICMYAMTHSDDGHVP